MENWIRRLFLRLALGKSGYRYMLRSVHQDKRCWDARSVDIVVRKDSVERRIEADWIKDIAKMTRSVAPERLQPYELFAENRPVRLLHP